MFAAAGCWLPLVPRAASSQVARPADSAWSVPGPLVRGRDLVTLGAFAAASAALMPVDERVARWMQRPTLQQRTTLRHIATVFRNLGDPGTLILSVATYGVGLVAHDRTTADIGLHATGAIAVGSLVGGVLKGTIGRARPYAVADSNAHDYRLGRGFRKGSAYQSLPSGHTTASFALASVLASETRHRWPRAGHVVTPVAYGAATMVALSRLYNNDHWASDVVLGAGVGTVSGLVVTRYLHSLPRNAVDRHLLPDVGRQPDTPVGSGRMPVSFSWTLHFR